MTISKKLRFDVFKRDFFTCQYCGATPPAIILEVDHIRPKSRGGLDDKDNLLTACFDCNRGKRDIPLSNIPESISKKAEILAEKEEQIKAYQRLIRSKRKREDRFIDQVEKIFKDAFGDNYHFVPRFRESIRVHFLQVLSQEQILFAIGKATNKISRAEPCIKYFCGICWQMIREQNV